MRLVIDHRTQGGAVEAVHLLGMADAFRRAGAEVSILSPPGVSVRSDGGAAAEPEDPVGPWAKLAARAPEIVFETMEIAYNVPAWVRIRRALAAARADALYERYAYFHVAGALAAGARNVPLLLEVNYTVDTPLHRRRSRLMRPLARAAERFVFRRAALLLAVSSVLRDRIVASGIPAPRVITLPNAADPVRFHEGVCGRDVRARFGLEGSRVIGFSGAFLAWHGVELLVEALETLLPEAPDAAALLVGDGPERAALEARVRRSGLADRVRFAGRVGHDRLPEYIAAFDIAVVPDSNEYGSPMKIFEYMAMGKPVVAPRLGPLEDGIRDGETGILVTPRDSTAFREALGALLRDEPRRAAMGARARAHVLAHHTWARNAARVLERIPERP